MTAESLNARITAASARRIPLKPALGMLLLATVATALLVPHVVTNHILSLSVPATQSLILGANLTIAALLIRILNQEIVRERLEKQALEHQLTSSFRYIGRANVSLEIVREHSEAVIAATTPKETRAVLQDLHGTMAAGVAKARSARLRVISLPTGHTITEFTWSRTVAEEPPAIRNGEVDQNASAFSMNPSGVMTRSSPNGTGIVCVFAATVSSPEECDGELLRTLIAQFHMLYLLGRTYHKEFK